jgi:aspartyl-tRNA(Asn)/glutamyl-tRNA(Gln) amidotransferase subunit C
MSNPQNSVTSQDVKKIARLSRLHVEADRLQPMADELNGILGWIEMLNEVDVEGVAPMTSAVDVTAPLRDDAITDGKLRDKVLGNAPKSDDGFFVVPRSVE